MMNMLHEGTAAVHLAGGLKHCETMLQGFSGSKLPVSQALPQLPMVLCASYWISLIKITGAEIDVLVGIVRYCCHPDREEACRAIGVTN